MEITAMAFGQAVPPEAQAPPAAHGEFAHALVAAKSGAPPGPEPPPTGEQVGKEVAKPGPNAPSPNPDFPAQVDANQIGKLATDSKDEKSTGPETGLPIAVDASLLAALAASTVVTIPVFGKGQIPQGVPNSATTGQFGSFATTPAIIPATQTTAETRSLGIKGTTATEIPVDAPPAPPVVSYNTPVPPVPSASKPATGLGIQVDPNLPSGAAAKVATEAAAPPSVQNPLAREAHMPVQGEQIVSATQIASDAATQGVSMAAAQVSVTADSASGAVAQPSAGAAPKAAVKPTFSAEGKQSTIAPDAGKSEENEKVEAKASVVEADPDGPSVAGMVDPKVQPKAAETVQATPSAQPIDRKDLNLVVRQIADRMELMAATRPNKGVTIQLQPAHLGNITMTVKSLAGGIEAHISASNDDVRTALQQNRSMLTQSLEQRGFKLESVAIVPQSQQTSTSTQKQSSQQQQQQQQQQQSQGQAHGYNGSAGSGGHLMTTQQARQTIRSIDGVDLWI